MIVKATVTTTITDGFQDLTCPAFLANQPALIPFQIDMLTAANFAAGGTAPVELNDSAYTVPFVNKQGYQIHADQFLREIQARQARARACNPCDPNLDNLDRFAHFRVVLVYDQSRLVVLDCLPRSAFVSGIADSANA